VGVDFLRVLSLIQIFKLNLDVGRRVLISIGTLKSIYALDQVDLFTFVIWEADRKRGRVDLPFE
jgi:hypothetical protein